MSDVAITATDERGAGAPPPSPPQGYQMWRRIRWIGYVLLSLQLVGFLVWSVIEYQHFSLTPDFSYYYQSWYLIAHGTLDPVITGGGVIYWHNDAEFFTYLLVPLYWISHAALMLQWAQDLSLVGAELVVFTWICDLVRSHCAERDAAWLAGLGVLLFVADPWLWWTVSFDVHMEPMSMFFVAFLAWDLSRGKRRAWVWEVLVLLCGAPPASYAIGIGAGGILAGHRTRRMGAAIMATGIAYMLVLGLVHGDHAATGVAQGYLAQLSDNPSSLLAPFWNERANIFANLAACGLLGIGAPLILPVVSGATAENSVFGPQFGEPLFQNVVLYVLMPVGTVAVLAWLLRRHRRVALVLAGVVAAQAIGWAAVWGPQTPGEWVRVSNSEAATLASVAARIPASAEVVASQGVYGRFSGRMYAYPFAGANGSLPVQPDTWFVITPTSAVETATLAASMALIGELAGPLHARLVTHANGVWAFLLTPPPGVTTIMVPGNSAPLPAWAAAGAAALPVLDGTGSGWHMAATGARGYVTDGIEWLENPGRYRAEVTLSASAAASGAPINVEVWDNNNTSTLLARRAVPQTDGIQQIVMPVAVPADPNETVFTGWGPFRAQYITPPRGQRIEVRVWSPGGAAVNVYSAELTAASGSAIEP